MLKTTSLLGYLGVILSLTTLKAFYQVGGLWEPANQRLRMFKPVFLDDLFRTNHLVPLMDYGGNFALFVPLGLLLFTFSASVRRTVVLACGLSFSIEVIQYIFALGRTDIDDLVFNTLGALCGALIAYQLGQRCFRAWQLLALYLTAIFALFVIA